MKINIILVVALMVVKCMLVKAGKSFCSITAVTYNTALVDRSIDTDNVIPNNRIERREAIIAMLLNSEADVICLQEVWIAEDAKAIVDGVISTFPHSHSQIHKKGSIKPFYTSSQGPLCNFLKLFALKNCVASACTSAATLEDHWTCMNTNCNTEYLAFLSASSEKCIACVFTALPNVTGILEMCSGAGIDDDYRRVNPDGLLLLSREAMRKRTNRPFFIEKNLVVRNKLIAHVRGIYVVCTHLSEEIVSFYPEVYVGPANTLTTFAEQNLAEASDLMANYGVLSNILVLGDFSSGLTVGDINGTMEASRTGLDGTFITKTVSDCTICDRDENPYNVANENYITAGVFGTGINIRRIKRVFTMDEGCITYNGQDLPLSDQFGVQAIITNTK